MGIQITRVGSQFNCYLLQTNKGYILIDTGTPPNRDALERDLLKANCRPGNLILIILTNGGLDGSGNCAYIRNKFTSKVAVHKNDAEKLNMKIEYWPKREYLLPFSRIFEAIVLKPLAMKMIRERELFAPDYCIDEGFDLYEYGLDAKVISLPGYTKGSIGILTSEGDLFSGNTLVNIMGNYISPYVMTNYQDLYASLEKLKKENIGMVYPCMGKPFPIERFILSKEGRNRK